MRLNIRQQTKHGDYVIPYLIEGNTVYCENDIIKNIKDFFETPPEQNVRIVTVSKNNDVLVEKIDTNDGFFENTETEETTENTETEETTENTETEETIEVEKNTAIEENESYLQDDVMNIEISTKKEEVKPLKKKSSVVFFESDGKNPYSDDY